MDVYLRENEMGDTYLEYSVLDEDKCKRLLFELSWNQRIPCQWIEKYSSIEEQRYVDDW